MFRGAPLSSSTCLSRSRLWCSRSAMCQKAATKNPGSKLDWLGALLATASLGALVYGLIESSSRGFGNKMVLTALITGVVASVLFFFVEARQENPDAAARAVSLDGFFRGESPHFSSLRRAFGAFLFSSAQSDPGAEVILRRRRAPHSFPLSSSCSFCRAGRAGSSRVMEAGCRWWPGQ